ncbi:PPOX class F420-dependent oxidoreductase [Luedemannella helvata]|uniref:PPOX class F420-dependent oxidoreductase n=1 Tax=Luedemannella helvata TaxID=349315 RepID=A0ABN2KT82_9ACTN
MAKAMTDAQWRAFVSVGTRTGKVATAGPPHVVPVWFVLDGDDAVFTTGRETVKGRRLARDSRAALCVDDERPPFAFVLLRGPVTLSEDLDDMLYWATRIGVRYMGEEAGVAFGARNAVPGEMLVRLRAEHVTAFADLTD